MSRRQFLQRGAMVAVAVSVASAAAFSAPLEIIQDASFEVPVVYGMKRALGHVSFNGGDYYSTALYPSWRVELNKYDESALKGFHNS